MFKNVCKNVTAILCGAVVCSSVIAQTNRSWKMHPVAIQTRWAKEVNPDIVLPEYPRPQMARSEWQNLNGLWSFTITDPKSDIPKIYTSEILVPFPIESALSGVKRTLLPTQLLWYKRIINRPKIKSGQRVLLNFGAVDWQATVYLNGKQIGRHTGGYTSFSFDVTNELKQGTNELIVKVYDPTNKGVGPHGKQVLNPSNIYYTPSSGIWQTVWLETVSAEHITDLKFTPDIDNGVLDLKVNLSDVKAKSSTTTTSSSVVAKKTVIQANSTVIPAEAGISSKYSIEVVVLSEGKEVLKQVQDDVLGVQNDGKNNNMALKVPDARLWSPDDPFLYDLIVRLKYKGKVIDEVKSYFGMRKIAIQKDEKGVDRIFLNNKYTYNLGTLDQGFWPDGLYTAPTDAALRFDIEVIKAMGFNTIRKHIKVEPARWYYYADKLGILVWQDFVNPNQALPEGAKAQYESEVMETLQQLHNSPAISTWVIFNEKWGAYDQQRITEWVKKTDPSRLVNGHSGELLYVNNTLRSPSPNAYISSDMTDVHSYPYPRMPITLIGKARVLGEFGGIGVPIEGHLWDDLTAGWGYDGIATPAKLKQQYSQMIDSLVELNKNGLSASIYTQPFDVESEQNGFVTYDRAIIKIPIPEIRKINLKLLPIDAEPFKLEHPIDVVDTIQFDYGKRKISLKSDKRDSASLRGLSIIALANRDTIFAMQLFNKYLDLITSPYAEVNLKYINRFTFNTDSRGFNIFLRNTEKVNKVLGINVAENIVMNILFKEKIAPFLTDSVVNWPYLEHTLIPKYGELAEERINSAKVIYYWSKMDWGNFGVYYKKHFEKVLLVNRNGLHINNLSWDIFENINDPEILSIAIKVMEYNLNMFDKMMPNAIDTYANLLYKAGRRDEAIKWEAKALELSKYAANYQLTYNKMMRNEKTWK